MHKKGAIVRFLSLLDRTHSCSSATMHQQLTQSPRVHASSIAINSRQRSSSQGKNHYDDISPNGYIERDHRHQGYLESVYSSPYNTLSVARGHVSPDQINVAAGYHGIYGPSPAPLLRRHSSETEPWRQVRSEGPFALQPYPAPAIPGHFGDQVASPSGPLLFNGRLSMSTHPPVMNGMGHNRGAYGLPARSYPNSMPLGGMSVGSPLPSVGDYGRPKWAHFVKPGS